MLFRGLVLGDVALTIVCNAEIGIAVLASSTALNASGDPGKCCGIFVSKLYCFFFACVSPPFSAFLFIILLRVQINNGTETTINN